MSEVVQFGDEGMQEQISAPSKIKRKQAASSGGDSLAESVIHSWNEDNFPLPLFSESVKKIIREGKLLSRTSEFLSEAGSHLISLMDGAASPKNLYSTYMAAILKSNPDIDNFTLDTPPGFEIGVRAIPFCRQNSILLIILITHFI